MANFDLRFLGIPDLPNMLVAQPNLVPQNMLTAASAQPPQPAIDLTTTGATPSKEQIPKGGIMAAFEPPQGNVSAPAAVASTDPNYYPPAPAADRAPVTNRPFALPQQQSAPQVAQQPTQGQSGNSGGLDLGTVSAFLQGLGRGNGLLSAIGGGLGAVQERKQENQTMKYLTAQGFSDAEAQVISRNPQAVVQVMQNIRKGADPKAMLELHKMQLDIAKANKDLNAPTKPNLINVGEGQLYNADSGSFITAPNAGRSKIDQDIAARQNAAAGMGLKPADTAYQSYVLTGKMPREDQAPLTATDKKAILEADEGVAAAENSIAALKSIITPGEDGKSLNDKAGYGWGAGAQSFMARNDPFGFFDDTKGQSTTELDNIVQTNALQSLKSIFGGNPTEGERAILLDIQGSSSKSPEERKNIFERAITMAERRLDFNRQRADELRGGTFYKQGSGDTSGGNGVNINGYSIERVQ